MPFVQFCCPRHSPTMETFLCAGATFFAIGINVVENDAFQDSAAKSYLNFLPVFVCSKPNIHGEQSKLLVDEMCFEESSNGSETPCPRLRIRNPHIAVPKVERFFNKKENQSAAHKYQI